MKFIFAGLLLSFTSLTFAGDLYPRLLDAEGLEYSDAKPLIQKLANIDYKNVSLEEHAEQIRVECEEVAELYRSYGKSKGHFDYASYLDNKCIEAEDNIRNEKSLERVIYLQIKEIKQRFKGPKAKLVTMKLTRDYTKDISDLGLSGERIASNVVVYPFTIALDALLLPFTVPVDLINGLYGERKVHFFTDKD